MKKTFKRLGAALLAMAMAVSVLCTGALADGSYSITIEDTTEGYTYEAYQVFAGTLGTKAENATETPLGITDWGSNLKGKESDLITALQGDDTFKTNGTNDFDNVLKKKNEANGTAIAANSAEAAQNVAAVLGTYTNDDAKARAFAKIVVNYLTGNAAGSTSTLSNDGYKIDLTQAGYYVVKNTAVPAGEAYSSNLLKVVGNEKVQPKTSVPTVEKKVQNPSNKKEGAQDSEDYSEDYSKGTTAQIGDTVNFTLTATLPDKYNDYQQYKLVFHDTLSKGLTLNKNSIEVYKDSINDNNKIDAGKYTIKPTGDTPLADGCTFEVEFSNLKDADSGVTGLTNSSKIIVKYTATLNENASLNATAGNINEVKLEYSNDPNHTGTGDPTGNTTKDEVKVYTTGLQLKKTDGTNILTGAEFEITGISHKVGYVYRQSEKGTYYKLADGTYSTTKPEGVDDASVTKYERIEAKTDNQVVKATATVGEDGILVIRGLGTGTYIITEIKAPNGYNLLQEPITITITANADKENCKWTVKKGEETINNANTDHLYEFEVVNKSGSTLPSTGGMGTTLFYIIGGVLMAGAAVVLVIKKKRSSAE